MFSEHPNGGTIEIESKQVNFTENEFRSIGDMKQDLEEAAEHITPDHYIEYVQLYL